VTVTCVANGNFLTLTYCDFLDFLTENPICWVVKNAGSMDVSDSILARLDSLFKGTKGLQKRGKGKTQPAVTVWGIGETRKGKQASFGPSAH